GRCAPAGEATQDHGYVDRRHSCRPRPPHLHAGRRFSGHYSGARHPRLGEIPEYWIVNLVDRQVEVFRDAGASPAGDTAYQTRFAAAVGDIVAPLLHPERRIEVITLLP